MDYFVGSGTRAKGTERFDAQRVRLVLFEQQATPAKILALDYHPDWWEDGSRANLDPHDVINMYDYFQSALDVEPKLISIGMVSQPHAYIVAAGRDKRYHAFNYVDGGVVKSQVRLDAKTQTVRYVLLPDNEGHVLETDTYDARGFLSRASLMTVTGRHYEDRYFTPNEELAITIKYPADSTIPEITLADGRQFSGIAGLQLAFLQAFGEDNTRFFFDEDYPELDLAKLTATQKIYVAHDQAIDVPSGYDQVIVATALQQAAIKARLPELSVVEVAPGLTFVMPEIVPYQARIKTLLVAVTAITAESGVSDLIDAFIAVATRFSEARLQIIGTGDPDLQNRLQARLRNAGLGQNVAWSDQGGAPNAILDRAGLFISAKPHASFDLAMQVALAHGVPVVAAGDDFGTKTLVIDGVNGELVKEAGVDALAMHIRRLLSHPERAASLSDGAYANRERYSAQAVWKQYLALLSSEG